MSNVALPREPKTKNRERRVQGQSSAGGHGGREALV